MDKNILKLIGVGVVAYYFLKNKNTDTTTGVTAPPVTTTPVTTTPVTTIPDTPIDDVITDPIVVTPEGIQGCQDPSATNFNSLATAPCDIVTPTGTSDSSNMSKGFDGESYEGGGLFINSDY
jgi:hypothetical protein